MPDKVQITQRLVGRGQNPAVDPTGTGDGNRECLKYIGVQINALLGLQQLVDQMSEFDEVQEDDRTRFHISLIDRDGGPIALANVVPGTISILRSRAGGAWSTIVNAVAMTAEDGGAYYDYTWPTASWDEDDQILAVPAAVGAVISGTTYYAALGQWIGRITSEGTIKATVLAIDAEVDASSLAQGAGSVASNAALGALARAISNIVRVGGTGDLAAILADTNELQGDWTNGGRLDLIIDDILADTNELQTDWTNGGRLDLLIDAIKAKTDQLNFNAEGTTEVLSESMRLGTQAKADVNAEVDDALDTAIPGGPTADSINQRIVAIDELTEAGGDGDLAAIKNKLDGVLYPKVALLVIDKTSLTADETALKAVLDTVFDVVLFIGADIDTERVELNNFKGIVVADNVPTANITGVRDSTTPVLTLDQDVAIFMKMGATDAGLFGGTTLNIDDDHHEITTDYSGVTTFYSSSGARNGLQGAGLAADVRDLDTTNVILAARQFSEATKAGAVYRYFPGKRVLFGLPEASKWTADGEAMFLSAMNFLVGYDTVAMAIPTVTINPAGTSSFEIQAPIDGLLFSDMSLANMTTGDTYTIEILKDGLHVVNVQLSGAQLIPRIEGTNERMRQDDTYKWEVTKDAGSDIGFDIELYMVLERRV